MKRDIAGEWFCSVLGSSLHILPYKVKCGQLLSLRLANRDVWFC